MQRPHPVVDLMAGRESGKRCEVNEAGENVERLVGVLARGADLTGL